MSYYLGQMGRAGARLVHSCRELYNDVNAAYLTGATDVLVVRQRDGSLKSTPFHARFGKLGVLRTGDLKEVEITLNGETVDLPMVIDESGKIFFSQSSSKATTQVSVPVVSGDGSGVGPTNQITGSVTTGNEMRGTRGSEVAGSDDVVIDMEQQQQQQQQQQQSTTTPMPVPQNISPEKASSHDGHVTRPSDHVTNYPTTLPAEMSGVEEEVTEGTLILTPHGGSDTEMEIERREDACYGRSLESDNLVGGVNYSHSAHWPLTHQRSEPIAIAVPEESETPPTAHYLSLPPDLEVMSDSALDADRYRCPRYLQMPTSETMVTALSDTEVEVKDRLSSKLWEWSADSSRHLTTSERERRKKAAVQTVSASTTSEEGGPSPSGVAGGNQAGFWGALTGMLRLRHQRRMSLEEGIYLDAIDDETMDPQQLSEFFPHMTTMEPSVVGRGVTRGGATSSGLGSSPISSSPEPSLDVRHQYRHDNSNLDKLVSTLEGVTLSLCGGLGQGTISEEAFKNSRVSFADFNSNPELLSDPKLVVRVRGKYYPWQVAAPMIMSAVVFLQPLPDAAQSKLQKKYMPKKRQSFWSFWGRKVSEEDNEATTSSRKSFKSDKATESSAEKWKLHEEADEEGGERGGGGREGERGGGRGGSRGDIATLSSDEETPPVATVPRPRLRRRRSCKLTNTPTSHQLARLDLRPGANEMVFSITTKFQGTTKAVCTVYLWDYHDRVVISDIDGTITRSDVVGQVLPLVGMDWTQNGVIELFNAIVRNGYKVLYLSSRAIGQAGYTKDFLRRLSRGGTTLPDGPLFLTPSSLVTAFRKEVIEKRPYEFKIACLQQVRSLFPSNYCPLHAGFGNRHSDVKSYTEVGVPRSRIFTVNHKGHLKYEILNTFQSSYMNLIEFVDAQFPPLDRLPLRSPSPPPSPHPLREEFSTFNYWRNEPPTRLNFDLDM